MGNRMRQSARLAIEGGTPVCSWPLSGWPHFTEEQILKVSDVLRSGKVNYWTGTEGRKFEQEYAEYLGVPHAIALTNGTVALELALHAIGLQPGDEVIVPSHTFVATASAVTMRGGVPVFADIDAATQNVTAETLAPQISQKTKAIIVVHMAGRPCEMDDINALANRHHLMVIEDCAQAHGALYRGRPVGTLGHLAAFSFCQDKIITTGGEGGLLATTDPELWKRAWSFKDHGKNWDKITAQPVPGVFRMLHDSLGTNWRLSEMQSALGRLALQQLDAEVQIRRQHAAHLIESLSAHPAIEIAEVPAHLYHSYYKFYFRVNASQLHPGWTRNLIAQAVLAEGVFCGSGSSAEIYLEQAFQTTGLAPHQRHPQAQAFGETSLMLQVHPTLTKAEIQTTATAVLKVLDVACTRPLQTPLPTTSQSAVA